jgi:hypothetical protein
MVENWCPKYADQFGDYGGIGPGGGDPWRPVTPPPEKIVGCFLRCTISSRSLLVVRSVSGVTLIRAICDRARQDKGSHN